MSAYPESQRVLTPITEAAIFLVITVSDHVALYIQESFSFRVATPEAAVALLH